MPSAANTPPLHVLRSILRHIRSAPKQTFPKQSNAIVIGSTTNNNEGKVKNILEERVLKQYRAAKHLSPTSNEAILKRKMAYNFHMLKKDLRERGRLHELDGGAEVKLSPKELSRRAAARAGLQLPEENTA